MFESSILEVHTAEGRFELKYVEFSLDPEGRLPHPQAASGELWNFLRSRLEQADWNEHEEILELFYQLTDEWTYLDCDTTNIHVKEWVLDRFESGIFFGKLRFEATFNPDPLFEPEWEPPPNLVPVDNRPPPLTPSELWGRNKPAEEKTFIGLRVFDQNEKPVKKTPVQVTLPNGRTIDSATDEQGELFIDGFVGDGNAKVTLLKFCVPGKSEAPEWPEEYEYRVQVTDESNHPVPNAWVKFTEGKQYRLALVDANGVATYKTKAAEGVAVTFHDMRELGTAMAPVWSASQAVAPEQWVQPVAEKVTVLSMRGGSLQERATDQADTKPFEQIALKAGQQHQISIQPHVTLARLVGMGFDTDKSFLLPTALPTMRRIKDLYAEHRNEILVIAAHADSKGGSAYNAALSFERARATLFFLTDDVEAWLDWYKTTVPESKRWGASEDRQMLRGLVARSKLDASVPRLEKPEIEPYQTWHNQLPPQNRASNWEPLTEDGKLGDATRAQLIGDYMNLDGTTLPAKALAAVYGCGENYPLPEPEKGSAWERFSEQRNRRVEFLFFDRMLGISPTMEKPQIAAPGSMVYPAWIAKAEIEDLTTEAGLKEVTFVEMHDALFRTNSAVVLPEGEDPAKAKSGTRALTSVGLFSTLLRYNEEHPSHVDANGNEVRKKLLIAGHTDTKGDDKFNQPLSEERAKVTLALLTGGQKGRDDFSKLCQARHDGIDLTQIMHWVADSNDFNFQCKPTVWDQTPSPTTVSHFKKSYNEQFDEKFKDIPGAKRFPKEDGTQDAALWGGIFDCYEYGLRCELGDMEKTKEGKDELARLRGELKWVDDKHQTMGFGEKFPVDDATKNDVRSQSNRRVEIMMFDEGEEPDLAAAATNPEVMETYLPGVYGKKPVKPMVSAKKWKAEWDRGLELLCMDDIRAMLLKAPGLPSGEAAQYVVDMRINSKECKGFGTIIANSGDATCDADWSEWFQEDLAEVGADLQAGQSFPTVSFRFTVLTSGRKIASAWLAYEDVMDVQLTTDTGAQLPNLDYQLATPWGYRHGKTDNNANLREAGIPPGGACLLCQKVCPAELDELSTPPPITP